MRGAAALAAVALCVGTLAEAENALPPAAAAVSPTVSMTDAPARVEEVRGTLAGIEAKAAPVASVVAIDERLPEITASIADRQARDRDYFAGDVDLGQLTGIRLRWSDDAALLAEWDQQLGRRASELGALVAKVSDLRALWERTRAGLREAAAPRELLERIDATLGDIARSGGNLAARQGAVLTLRNRVAQQSAAVAEIQVLVEERSKQALGSLQVRDQPPVWRAPERRDESVGERVREAFAREREDLREFLTSRLGRAPAALAALVALMAVAVLLARRARNWGQRTGDAEEAVLVIERPLSAVFVVWVLILPWLHVPMVVRRLTSFALIIPVARLLRPLLGRKGTVLTAFLASLLVLDRLEEVLVDVPEIARPLFLAVMAIGVAAARWVHRQQWAGAGEDGVPTGDWIRRSSRTAEVVLGVAVVASLLGYRQLAALLGDGTVTAALAALAFWVSSRVLDGVVVVALRSRPLNALHLVQRNQNRAIRGARRLVAWTLAALWVVFVLEMFHLRGLATEALAAVLGTLLTLGAVAFTLGDLLVLGLSIWASFLLARAVRVILEDEVLSRVHLERGIPYAISTFASYAVLVVGLLIALAATGIDMSRLTIVVGALGVGVGLGLQEIVKDLVAGAVLLFERPVQLGDVVQMSELTGTVQRIGLRSSTVHTFDGAEVIVPNSSLTSSQIVNWTLSDRARRVDLPVGVAYGTDPARVIALLEELARRHADVLEEPPPKALFMGFGESTLDFQLRAWTNRVDQFMAVRSELAIAVVTALADAQITLPFPQRDLHLRTVAAGVLGRPPAAAVPEDDGGR